MQNSFSTILVATHNPGKLQELKKILEQKSYTLVSLSDVHITHVTPETGTTFRENALLKARNYAQLSLLPTIADDGGLSIDALGGAPGVYSARYAGPDATDEEKVAFILDKMRSIPTDQRHAQFIGVIALVTSQGYEQVYQASIDGFITAEPRGKLVKGLPYRQIFLLPEYGKTMAELDEMGIAYESHRSKSLALLLKSLT